MNSDAESHSDEDLGHYKYPAWVKMETALEEYQQDRHDFLKRKAESLGPAAVETLRKLRTTALTLVNGMGELSGVDAIAEVREIVIPTTDGKRDRAEWDGQLDLLDLLDEELCIDIAWETLDLLTTSRCRLWDLLALIKPIKPGWRAAAFLKRVSRCFLFGFDAECVVMCRSVLETAFEAEVSNDDCIDALGQPRQSDRQGEPLFSFIDRIRAAKLKGKISDETARLAHEVRKAGREAVHRWPKPKSGSEDIIRMTVEVLMKLEAEG